MRILVTGAAGFIGYHVSKKLLERGEDVVGIDCLNDYYDPALKEARLKQLEQHALQANGSWHFHRDTLTDNELVQRHFSEYQFERVIHLAAQAGVRHSLKSPLDYVQSNIVAFTNILEACRHHSTPHLTYASTSSIYGANTKLPFSETDTVDHPIQFYAATKRANELMAHAYSHLFGLPTTGLRFFSVYGPWGRPDMALYLFTEAIVKDEPIKVFNNGNHLRDFTYVDDIVEGIVRVNDQIAEPDPKWNAAQPNPHTSNVPFRIYNIGNNNPVHLSEYIAEIERALGKEAIRTYLPLQPGDVPDSFASAEALIAATGYQPKTSVRFGVSKFVEWYLEYHNL